MKKLKNLIDMHLRIPTCSQAPPQTYGIKMYILIGCPGYLGKQ
jgi:hypothetical protein